MTGSRMIATIDFSKTFDFVWHPTLFHKLISAGLPPCFDRWTQYFFCEACLRGFSKSPISKFLKSKFQRVASFKSVEVFRKDPFLALYVSLSLSMIFLLLCIVPSAVLVMLTIWPFVPPSSQSLCGGGHLRSYDSTGALV